MPVICADCPRCGAQKMTFDARGINLLPDVNYGWQQHGEVFSVCRECRRTTVFYTQQTKTEFEDVFGEPEAFANYRGSLNAGMKIMGHVSPKDRVAAKPPEHVPTDVAAAFREAATCLAVECWSASGGMFRKALDLATRPLLPGEEIAGLNARTRRDLGLRVAWLLQHGLLPSGLTELAKCVREDGNDGVHSFALSKEDALDLQDFTTALLERLFTEPEKLRLAEQRRDARRTASSR